jgi:virginiamycin B lyase
MSARVTGVLVSVFACLTLGGGIAGAGVSEAPSAETKRCKPGFRHAVIGGRHACLRAGQRCTKRLDRQYHRYRFHCHAGRLTRSQRPQPPRTPPPPAPPSQPSDRVAATIPVGFSPMGIVFGEGAVWAASAFGEPVGRVVRIDPRTNAVVATISLPATGFTWMSAGFQSIWVAIGEGGDQPKAGDRLVVVRIDPQTNTVAATIRLGIAPERPAPLAVGEGAVWVTNFAASTVTKIDPATNAVVATIPTTPEPERDDRGHPSGIAVAAGAVWVMNHRESTLLRIDPRTNQIVGRIQTLDGRVAAGEGSVWVASAGRDEVARIDPATNTVQANIRDCSETQTIVAGGGAVWVTSSSLGLCRIDPAQNRVVAVSHEVVDPLGVAFGEGAAWVSSRREKAVFRVERGP